MLPSTQRHRWHISSAVAVPILLLLACSQLQTAAGYPNLWTLLYAAGPSSCTLHPTSAYLEHGYDPTPDTTTTFAVLLASTAKPVAGGNLVCAGEVYNIKVTFTKISHLLMTATVGSFGSRRCDANCLNRVCPSSTYIVGSYNLTLPCDAEGPIEVAVTHAEAQNAPMKTAKITLQVDPTCQKPPACSGVSPQPSPTPSPQTPSPAPSPKPSPPPPASQTLTLTKSTNKALSLAKPKTPVKITVSLSGSSSQRANKTLRVRVPKTLNCQPRTLVTDASGRAEVSCLPKAKGNGRVVAVYRQLTADVLVRVVD